MRAWLLQNADVVIRNILGETPDETALLQNSGVSEWIKRLSERSEAKDIGAIHGSHDYRMENILGKCSVLGLSKNIAQFDENIKFILQYLNRHIESLPPGEPGFGRIYHFRDNEKVLACFLPFLGYHDDFAVEQIAGKRIEVLHSFTKQKRYDIYTDGSKLKGVKKEWQPYIINPDLYSDGHIPLPDMHDLIMFAGMYPFLSEDEREKIETIIAWLFCDSFRKIYRRYGYFYVPGGAYSAKAVIFKPHLPDFNNAVFDKGELVSLLYTVFIFSHFKTAKNSDWFTSALAYLDLYKNSAGRYCFPPHMITEKSDSFVIHGGHMNAGENKKNKMYGEIISTYWMEGIAKRISQKELEKS